MTATERPSEIALSIALDTLDQIGSMTKRGRGAVVARAAAAFIRTQMESRALDAAPADPSTINPPDSDSTLIVPSAECWRAALYEAREEQEWITTQQAEWIEHRARELAREER